MEKQNHSSVLKKPAYRKLEDLNLLDDFLFQQMLLQKDTGEEFCRILLSTILGKPIRNVNVISQKSIPGIDLHQHGIRMDAYIETASDTPSGTGEVSLDAEILPAVYDIEPNKYYEKATLPKRMRYYHGLIDTRLLSSHMTYKALPEVVIIIILPYDPFDSNRMVYTVQNQCIEDSRVRYEDGAKKIFLYTKGVEGNPSQELRDMLKYIEETTADNVTNSTIAAVDNLVSKVKHSREVSVSYMKSWEWEEIIREEATREGIEQGTQRGLIEGRKEGKKEGKKEALMESTRIFIETCQELNISKEDAASKLIEKYHLSADEAERSLTDYWN